MQPDQLKELLENVRDGAMSVEDATGKLSSLPFNDLGYARVDLHRQIRRGAPEVIYCAGKTPEQVAEIARTIDESGQSVLGTRATRDMYDLAADKVDGLEYDETARCLFKKQESSEPPSGRIAVVCAGTSDVPVAEEAALTAEVLGNPVDRVYDAGVAGIHRLLRDHDVLRKARVAIVAAGMEGALPSVVGGLVACPVIAVPTSVGYGAAFGGLAALLGMLNSCAGNVAVVNIDNGFGAAYIANMINRD